MRNKFSSQASDEQFANKSYHVCSLRMTSLSVTAHDNSLCTVLNSLSACAYSRVVLATPACFTQKWQRAAFADACRSETRRAQKTSGNRPRKIPSGAARLKRALDSTVVICLSSESRFVPPLPWGGPARKCSVPSRLPAVKVDGI